MNSTIYKSSGMAFKINENCGCLEMDARSKQYVYLDYNATTYIRPEISELLVHYYKNKLGYGNPSSPYMQGINAARYINAARENIARCLSVNADEICFTGSGTESNNLAIKGIAFNHLRNGGHLITTKTEHASVLNTMRYLETLGFEVTYLDVDSDGMVSAQAVKNAIRSDTILVSVIAANNEIGTVNPLKQIGDVCRNYKIPFAVDGVQAFGHLPIEPEQLGISLMSFSAHKIYAPKGIGGLYVKKGIDLVPLIHGGNQEYGYRAGTENVGSIIAFGKAAELACSEMMFETVRYLELRDYLLTNLKKIDPSFRINGSMEHRIPNNLSISFPGVDSKKLISNLRKAGISVSGSSACSSSSNLKSHVLEAIGVNEKRYATVRIGFGLKTNTEELDYLLKCLEAIIPMSKVRV